MVLKRFGQIPAGSSARAGEDLIKAERTEGPLAGGGEASLGVGAPSEGSQIRQSTTGLLFEERRHHWVSRWDVRTAATTSRIARLAAVESVWSEMSESWV